MITNRRIKTRICELMSLRDGQNYEFRHFENRGVKNLKAGLHLMPTSESSTVVLGIRSITAPPSPSHSRKA